MRGWAAVAVAVVEADPHGLVSCLRGGIFDCARPTSASSWRHVNRHKRIEEAGCEARSPSSPLPVFLFHDGTWVPYTQRGETDRDTGSTEGVVQWTMDTHLVLIGDGAERLLEDSRVALRQSRIEVHL